MDGLKPKLSDPVQVSRSPHQPSLFTSGIKFHNKVIALWDFKFLCAEYMTSGWFLTTVLVKCQIFSKQSKKASVEDPRWAPGGGMDKEEREYLKDKPQCAPVQGPTGGEQCPAVLLWSSNSGYSWEQGGGNGKQESAVKVQGATQKAWCPSSCVRFSSLEDASPSIFIFGLHNYMAM